MSMESALPTPEELQRVIAAQLDCHWLKVDGDGRHFDALIVSAAFEGKSRIERHRLVYAALGDRMRDRVHALSMKTLTPGEHQQLGSESRQ
ncbi:MAG TPA: BolA/IbaG family iron-sulfur metabolism protein [Burkholderiaceae bacterium]|nr:BolA/IbaG family iron-sulfur metabolism protein [Burkholderiaceae bacterium]